MDLQALNDKIDSALGVWEDFKKTNDEREKILVKKGDVDSLLDAKLKKQSDAIISVMEEKQKAEMKANEDKLQKQLDDLKASISRLPDGKSVSDEEQKELNKKFLNAFARGTGKGGLGKIEMKDFLDSNEEYKALSVNSGPDGGYTVMPVFMGILNARIFETSPMRSIASVETIGTDTLRVILDDDEAGAGWIGETGSRTETGTPQIRQKDIPVFEMYAAPKATQKLIEDSLVNMEQWLTNKITDRFARLENSAFVIGDGVNKPKGFATYPAWTTNGVYEAGKLETVKSGSNSTFTADGIIALQNSLIDEQYQANAKWVVRRGSFGEIMKLKNGNGEYIFNRAMDMNVGRPFNLLGQQVVFFADMPAIALNSKPLAYGDFSRGYQIVDRIGISLLKDPYSTKPFVIFYATKRVGGDVINFQAIKLQVISA